jgi:hypothetical protein
MQVVEHSHGGAKKSRIPISIQRCKKSRKNWGKLAFGKCLRCFSKLKKSSNANTHDQRHFNSAGWGFQAACHAGNCIRAGGRRY